MHEETIRCPTCEPKPGEVNHPDGMIFIGWGRGWTACPDCGGSMRISKSVPDLSENVPMSIVIVDRKAGGVDRYLYSLDRFGIVWRDEGGRLCGIPDRMLPREAAVRGINPHHIFGMDRGPNLPSLLRARAATRDTSNPELAEALRAAANEWERIAAIGMPTDLSGPLIPTLATIHTHVHADGHTTARSPEIPGYEGTGRNAHEAIGDLLCRARSGFAMLIAHTGTGDEERESPEVPPDVEHLRKLVAAAEGLRNPCKSCGADPSVHPDSGAELPIVRGALDAQEDAERRLFAERERSVAAVVSAHGHGQESALREAIAFLMSAGHAEAADKVRTEFAGTIRLVEPDPTCAHCRKPRSAHDAAWTCPAPTLPVFSLACTPHPIYAGGAATCGDGDDADIDALMRPENT